MIKLVLTTSPAPWHPSIDITVRSIESKQEMLGWCPRPIISCDGVAPYCTREDRRNYYTYLQRLERCDIGEIRMSPTFVGHAGTLAACFDGVTTDLILATEDDEVVIEPVTVDAAGICKALTDDNPVQCIRLVRFNPLEKRRGGGNYKVIRDLGTEYGVPLLANRGFATSTHFATREFYQRRVIPNLDRNVSVAGDGRGGVERIIWTKYRDRCKEIGEFEAWKEWGVCMYWDGQVRLDHIGKERKKWREERTDKRQD